MANWWDDLLKKLAPGAFGGKQFQGVTNKQGQGLSGQQFQGLTNPQFQGVSAPQFQGLSGSQQSSANSQESDFLNSLRHPQTSSYGPLVPNYVPNPAFQQQTTVPDTPLPSMADALAQATAMWNKLGGGGFTPTSHVSYDPLRQDATKRAGEYDAKLAAMYGALSNDFSGAGAGIAQNYDQGAAQQAAQAQAAQQQIQQASDAANATNQQNLAALGIQQANVNTQDSGQSLADQTAAAIADSAARAQTAQAQMTGDKQASLKSNTDTAQAAQLAGSEEQNRVQDELSKLLAQYALSEQQANTQIDQQNAAGVQNASQNRASFISGQANNLLSNAWQTQQYKDQMAQQQYNMLLAQQAQAAQAQQQQSNADQANAFLQQLLSSKGDKVTGTDIAPFLKYVLPSAPGALKVG